MNRIFGQLGTAEPGMHIQIDKNAPVPLYRQSVAEVRRLIDAGLLATGNCLPTPRELLQKLETKQKEPNMLCIAFSGS